MTNKTTCPPQSIELNFPPYPALVLDEFKDIKRSMVNWVEDSGETIVGASKLKGFQWGPRFVWVVNAAATLRQRDLFNLIALAQNVGYQGYSNSFVHLGDRTELLPPLPAGTIRPIIPGTEVVNGLGLPTGFGLFRVKLKIGEGHDALIGCDRKTGEKRYSLSFSMKEMFL